MAKKMKTYLIPDEEKVPKKVKKERIPPSAAMTIPRAVFGSDLMDKKNGGKK